MILLDLFCGAGGAAKGYWDAGFTVIGVDINPQPNYPYTFFQDDAVDYLSKYGKYYHAIHASPPCQAHSTLKKLHPGKEYKCFISATRNELQKLKVPYVIENVVGAPLINPIQLCGSSFGLRVRRHRLFESNVPLRGLDCDHAKQSEPVDVSGTGGRRIGLRADGKGGNSRKPLNLADARDAMGIGWMTRKELSQAIPPEYTTFLGKQLMEHLNA